MAEMRRQTAVPLAAGQNEGLAYRFRDLLLQGAVDVLQPNVAIGGGFTQCVKVAGMASAFNVPIANGGAWPFHNMHLHAGVANGGFGQFTCQPSISARKSYDGLPAPKDGWLTLPTTPGLGFAPNIDRVVELAKRPLRWPRQGMTRRSANSRLTARTLNIRIKSKETTTEAAASACAGMRSEPDLPTSVIRKNSRQFRKSSGILIMATSLGDRSSGIDIGGGRVPAGAGPDLSDPAGHDRLGAGARWRER